jgi:hypothetical protein
MFPKKSETQSTRTGKDAQDDSTVGKHKSKLSRDTTSRLLGRL